MAEGRITFTEHGHIYFVRLEGDVRYTISSGFDRLISEITERPEIQGVVLDLSQTAYIDSTNLGLMARIAKFSLNRLGRKPLLVTSNEEVSAVIDSMGFDQVFEIVQTTCDNGLDFEVLETEEHTPDARLLLDAHKALSALNEKNENTFRDVIELLEAELRS